MTMNDLSQAFMCQNSVCPTSSLHYKTSPDRAARPKFAINRARILSSLLLLVFLLSAGIARAQELTATLNGTVTDASGAVIPNATLTIQLNGFNGPARQAQ